MTIKTKNHDIKKDEEKDEDKDKEDKNYEKEESPLDPKSKKKVLNVL